MPIARAPNQMRPQGAREQTIGAVGRERVETFDDARRLEERQRDLEQTLAKDGFTGPHGWNL